MTLLHRPRRARDHVTFVYRKAVVVGKVVTRFAVMLLGVVIFAQLADEVHEKEIIRFDEPILGWLRERQSPALTGLMLAVTRVGATNVLISVAVAAGILLWLHRNKRAAIFVWVTGAGAGLMVQGLKAFFERARPEEWLRLTATSGFAFPSGHSMGAAAVYGALAIVAYTRFPHIKWPAVASCLALVFGVGLSRMYLAVHYPSDVLAGWALGFTWPLWLKHPLLTRPWNGFWRGKKAPSEASPAEPVSAAE